MKKSKFTKAVSLLLAVAVFFTSNYMLLHAFAGGEDELPTGVGIYNNTMTSKEEVQTKYILRFYKHDTDGTQTLVHFTAEMQIDGAKYLTPNTEHDANDSAYIILDKGQQIVFSENSSFNTYIKNNLIDKIEISYVTELLDMKETSLLYTERTLTYDFTHIVQVPDPTEEPTGEPTAPPSPEPTGEPTEPVITYHDEVQSKLDYTKDNPFKPDDEHYVEINDVEISIKQYDSTEMRLFTVEQDWRDRGDNNIRPNIEDVKFDVTKEDDGTFAVYLDHTQMVSTDTPTFFRYEITDTDVADNNGRYDAYLELQTSNSNTYLYNYTVPEKDKNGNDIVYSSEQFFPVNKQDAYKQEPKTVAAEHVEGKADEQYLAVGLTDFNFRFSWADAYDHTARPIPEIPADATAEEKAAISLQIANYVKNNFTLYNKSGDVITFLPNDVTASTLSRYFEVTSDNNGTYSFKIKHLEEIAEDGTSNEYYIQHNADVQGHRDKVAIADKDYDTLVDKTTDYYLIKSENEGIHANDVDKTYEGGVFDLLLAGKKTFGATVRWEDNEYADDRARDDTAAELSLWRYSADLSDGQDPRDFSAIVQDHIVIDGAEDESQVSVPDLDKYDINGQIFNYYASETLMVENPDDPSTYLPYQSTYITNNDGVDEVTEKLYDGGTVVNKLSQDVQFTVSAKWVAASRQGGTADVTYQLQRGTPVFDEQGDPVYVQDVDEQGNPKTDEHGDPVLVRKISWEPATDESGNVIQKTIRFDELHMTRSGEDVCIFPSKDTYVDRFDENGNAYEYRIVETNVTRKDENVTTQYDTENHENIGENIDSAHPKENGELIPDNDTIKDRYAVLVTRSGDGSNFYFQYNIIGDTFVNVTKLWQDENGQEIQTTNEYSMKFYVQNFNDNQQQYVRYFVESEYPEGYFDAYIYDANTNPGGYFVRGTGADSGKLFFKDVQLTNNSWSENKIPVPRYDNEGREIAYRAVELTGEKHFPSTDAQGRTVNFYTTYGWSVTQEEDGTNYNYTIRNHRTYEGDENAEIAVNKEWVDDGELEYRKPIRIVASKDVYTPIGGSPTSNSTVLQQNNVWEGRLPITFRYEKDGNGDYILDENGDKIIDEVYTYNPDDFSESPVNPTADETYYWYLSEIQELVESGKTVSDELVWIYQLLTGEKWGGVDYSSVIDSDNSVDMRDENTIAFNGFSGIFKGQSIDGNPQHCHYYAVRQVYDNSGVNGTRGTLRFINTRIGVINYEVNFDWKVGDALTRQNNKIENITLRVKGKGLPANGKDYTVNISDITQTVDEQGHIKYSYYILNLPKYDEKGKLIEYTIDEIKIGDATVSDGSRVTVGSDSCYVSVSSETIVEGPEGKSDDLHKITISNTFEADTSISVHKKWADNSNAENTRPDLFIKLNRLSSRDKTSEPVTGEYKWTQHDSDTINYWTYTFTDLPKYDDLGYPYTYYVTEQDEGSRLPGYHQEYINDNLNSNPKVFLGVNGLTTSDLPSKGAFDGGTIRNSLYGELTIEGEKLWHNISSLLALADYPIARVTLFREVDDGEATPQDKLDELAEMAQLTDEELSSLEIQISEPTEIRSGGTAFKFTQALQSSIDRKFVILDSNGNVVKRNGSIVLPKYDGLGRRIHYFLKEEQINGFVSKIVPGSQKLINEYDGGRKLQITVRKDWVGMTGQTNYPTIKFTLHQVFQVDRGEGSDPRYINYEFNHFDREVKARDDSSFTVTFGDDDHHDEANSLRYYSPVGTPFTYFVTETLSNYDGDMAIFVESDKRQYISQYLASYSNNPKCEIIELETDENTGNPTGKALGFTSQISQQLESVEDVLTRSIDIPDEDPETHEAYTEEEKAAMIREELDRQLSDTEAEAVGLNETYTNTYKPDENNFKGRINVTKDWNYQKTDNGDNSEFDDVKSYEFTLSRRTKLSENQQLFKVKTIDSLTPEMENPPTPPAPEPATQEPATQAPATQDPGNQEPETQEPATADPGSGDPNQNSGSGSQDDGKDYWNPVPTFEILPDGVSADVTIAQGFIPTRTDPDTVYEPSDIVPLPAGQTPLYYIGVLEKDNKYVIVSVSVADAQGNVDYNNKVSIHGFAIYGRDALKYYYTITETPKSGFTATSSGGTEQLSDNIAEAPTIALANRLDVISIKLYKSFGREYEKEQGLYHIEPIPIDDFRQFFNDDYFRQLTFELHRESSGGADRVYKSVTGEQILQGNDPGKYLDTRKNAYFYTFKDVPLTDVEGNYYTYKIVEVDGAQLKEENGQQVHNDDAKVFTLYSSELRGTDAPRPDLATQTTHSIVLSENDKGAPKDRPKETYVQNVFKAKKININKYWLDNNNEDGLRPEELTVTITEKLPGDTPAEDATVNFTRVLSKETRDSDDTVTEVGWTLQAALARYYYNGSTLIDDLEYKIDETDLSSAGYQIVVDSGSGMSGGRYVVTDANNKIPVSEGDPNEYTVPGRFSGVDVPLSDVNYKPIGGDNVTLADPTGGEGGDTPRTFDSLNITNYKKPQKGELKFEKKFNEPAGYNFKPDTRPRTLYFKLTDENGSVFKGYETLDVKVKLGDTELTAEQIHELSTTGIIAVPGTEVRETVTDPGSGSSVTKVVDVTYPNITVSNLPIGYSEDGGVQLNGSEFVAHNYKFVECVSSGMVVSETYDSAVSNDAISAAHLTDGAGLVSALNSGKVFALVGSTPGSYNAVKTSDVLDTAELADGAALVSAVNSGETLVQLSNYGTYSVVQGSDVISAAAITTEGQWANALNYGRYIITYDTANSAYVLVQGADMLSNALLTTEADIVSALNNNDPLIAYDSYTDEYTPDVLGETLVTTGYELIYALNDSQQKLIFKDSNDDYSVVATDQEALDAFQGAELTTQEDITNALNQVRTVISYTPDPGENQAKFAVVSQSGTIDLANKQYYLFDSASTKFYKVLGIDPPRPFYSLTFAQLGEYSALDNHTIDYLYGFTNSEIDSLFAFDSNTLSAGYLETEADRETAAQDSTKKIVSGIQAPNQFAYSWDGAEKGTESINGVYAEGHETVTLIKEEASSGDTPSGDDPSGGSSGGASTVTYENEYEITNTLKTETHTVKKKWNDESNYYNTRQETFTVTLYRSTDNGYVWEPVYRDEYMNPIDTVLNTNLQSGDYINYLINDLPAYDNLGNKICYRVEEVKIGDKPLNSTTNVICQDGEERTFASNASYYVVYNNEDMGGREVLDDQQTIIDNQLIRKLNPHNFRAYKLWDDGYDFERFVASNQDSKRPDYIEVVFEQSVKIDGEEQIVKQFVEQLSPQNGWFYQWTNFPNADENGNLYEYKMYERLPSGSEYRHDPETDEVEQHSLNQAGEETTGEGSWTMRDFTNRYDPQYKSLTVDKQWLNESTSEDKKLRPSEITYDLYCKYTTYNYVLKDDHNTILTWDEDIDEAYAANNLEIVKGRDYDGPVFYNDEDWDDPNSSYELYLSSGLFYGTTTSITVEPTDRTVDSQWNGAVFNNLPVYVNTCGTDHWPGRSCAIQYYVKEREPDLGSGKVNPYFYGVNNGNTSAYSEENVGNSPITDLTAGNAAVTASNKLKDRDITVTKVWDDKGYTADNLHYDIDFTLTCDTSAASGFGYEQTLTLTKDSDPNSVTFENLPKYDKDGAVLTYNIEEKVHVASGTAPDYKYGYVQTTTETKDGEILTGYTITNTLPVVKLRASKLWNDNDNQDGSRPATLQMTLSRTPEGSEQPASASAKTDGSSGYSGSSAASWTSYDFGIQPRYNSDNTEYVYSVTEPDLSSSGYTRYVYATGSNVITEQNNWVIAESETGTDTVEKFTESGYDVVAFRFKNKYTPKVDSLTVNKSWADTVGSKDYSAWTRPTQVTVTLCYKFNNGQVVNLENAPLTDDVKKLFPNAGSYAFTRNILVGESWQQTFTDLPVNVNPTGTAVYNGTSYPITYSVVETPLNGYTTSYSPSNGTALTDGSDSLTVTNTLKTKTVKVRKEWNDGQYSGDQSQHYPVTIDLVNTNTGVTYPSSLTSSYNETKVIPYTDASVTETVDFLVPQYLVNGAEATYTVTENVTLDKKYGYDTTYSSNHDFNAAGIADNAIISVYNRLPLTEVSFAKEWDDSNNLYESRPANIKIQLFRRTVTNNGTAWGSADAGWQACGDKVTLTAATYTFSKLPKFDENNIEYEYKVVEDKVNAYDTSYKLDSNTYQDTPVVKQDDGTTNTDSTISFGVKNTLITKSITLNKVWIDKGYTDTHYDVTYTIKQPASGLDGSKIKFDDVETYDTTGVQLTNDPLTAAQWSAVVQNVPVYDRDGKPIQYRVEELNDSTHLHHYGYDKKETATATDYNDKYTVVTQNGTHTGNGQYYGNYFDTYTITNELPVTEVKAVKHWAGDLELYPNSSADVKVKLTRESNNSADSTFNAKAENTKTIAYDAAAGDDYVTYNNLLVKDYDNYTYIYKIEEPAVKGYATTYSPADQKVTATKADLADRTVTVTNTPKKQTADFVKYDATDLQKHGGESNFRLVTLQGAEFELHKKYSLQRDGSGDLVLDSEGKPIQISDDRAVKVTLTDGVYHVDADQDDPNGNTTVVSGSDGKIAFAELEPNEYYLVELAPTQADENGGAPEGYQYNPSLFGFTVSIDGTNQIAIAYSDKKAVKSGSSVTLDGAAFTDEGAKVSLTDLSGMNISGVPSVNGIPNVENMSRLNLKKVDANATGSPLSDATYYLLRLYNFEYKKPQAQGSTEAEYLENALSALRNADPERDDFNTRWATVLNYWERVGEDHYQTNSSGVINIAGHMFGTYVFYEVKAPTGFHTDRTYSDSIITDTNADYLGPVEFNNDTAQHDSEVHFLTHKEPRKDASIKVLKTDVNGNPLRGAKFELYTANGEPVKDSNGNNIVVSTGYDGMNAAAIVLDTSEYSWGQRFYFIEETAPKGYSADNEDDAQGKKRKIEFTLDRDLAEETLHVVRANDARLKGKVDLTKLSSEATVTTPAGTALSGAEFELFTKNGASALAVYKHHTENKYRVVNAVADADADVQATITAEGYDLTPTLTRLTTGSDGKLHVEGLDWDDYYLKEVKAPLGYKLPSGEAAKVYFTVGRNNCGDVAQQFTMKDDPQTAQLSVTKHIDTFNAAAWGEPTFIFTLKQTQRYDYSTETFTDIPAIGQPTLTKTVSPTTAAAGGGYQSSTGLFDVEPGTYVVTEVRVARYMAAASSVTTALAGADKLTAVSNGQYDAVLSIKPDGQADVKFDNKLSNYEKLNHTDGANNRFNGYKELRVEDKDEIVIPASDSSSVSITVTKASLDPVLVKSSGETVPVTDLTKLAVSYTPVDADDPEITVTETSDKTSIVVSGRREDISGSIYKLSAVYDGNFSDDFELRFKSDPLFSKTEKTVYFHNDDDNKSYYQDGAGRGARNGVYALTFIIETNGSSHTVKKILHNGIPTGSLNEASFPELMIDELFRNEVEFKEWRYSYTGRSGTAATNGLLDIILNAPDNEVIDITAVLKPKS